MLLSFGAGNFIKEDVGGRMKGENYICKEENGIQILAFGDEDEYFIIQYALEQESVDSQDSYYIEKGGQSAGMYNGIEKVEVNEACVKFYLDEKAISLSPRLEIEVDISKINKKSLIKDLKDFTMRYGIDFNFYSI